MTVYVDDAFIPARVGRLSSRWCHMTADSIEELHQFALKIGMKQAWFQDPTCNTKQARAGHSARPGSLAAELWHYDVTEPKRNQAVKMGAMEITSSEMILLAKRGLAEGNRDGGAEFIVQHRIDEFLEGA